MVMILEDRQQRIAFARIISDLIEADSIIEDTEIDFFESVMDKFHISRDMLIEAKKRSFEWAVNVLRGLDAEQVAAVKEILHSQALSDGTCVPSEALQIMAVCYALDNDGEVFSIPSSHSVVENGKVIYVDSDDNSDVNRFIQQNFRSIANELKLAGFDFVYIPRIAEDYKRMGENYLRKSISYMVPSLDDFRVGNILTKLCSITTSRFCQEILYAKMGIKVLGCKPSLLFKIGDTYAVGENSQDDGEKLVYSNYLKVDIADDILSQVAGFTEIFRGLLNCRTYTELAPAASKFLYSGFHRSLFDLIVFSKERTDYRVLVNIEDRSKPTISFKAIEANAEDEEIKLSPMAATLYVLMLQQSVFASGLDWRENLSKHQKALVMEKFNAIYKEVGNREEPMDFKDRVLVSRIKKELRKQQPYITNIALFVPELRTVDDIPYYAIPVHPDLVWVVRNNEEILMCESKFWRNL